MNQMGSLFGMEWTAHDACVAVKITPCYAEKDRSLDISMNSCARIKVGLQNHK